jgi:hypothetical protein
VLTPALRAVGNIVTGNDIQVCCLFPLIGIIYLLVHECKETSVLRSTEECGHSHVTNIY